MTAGKEANVSKETFWKRADEANASTQKSNSKGDTVKDCETT